MILQKEIALEKAEQERKNEELRIRIEKNMPETQKLREQNIRRIKEGLEKVKKRERELNREVITFI